MFSVASLCDSADILSVFKIIRITLLIIRIVVPILLVVSLSLDFARAVPSQDQDMIKKASMNAVRKAICMALVFFLPNFLSIVVNLSSGDDYYKTCLENSTNENINAIYLSDAQKYMSKVRETLLIGDYYKATSAIRKIKDENLKQQYSAELEEIKEVIEVKELVARAESTKKEKDYEKAASAVEGLPDGELKSSLNSRLETVAQSMKSYMADYSSGGEYIENALGIPRYDQCDPRWGSIPYSAGGGTNGGPATFCSSSCGYTSFAMVAAGLTHDVSITPVTVVNKMRNINVSVGQISSLNKGAANTSELTSKASVFGLKVSNLNGNIASIQNALNSGKAVIALVPNHFIVLAPSSNSNNAVLLDPFSAWADSRKKSGTYPLSYIFSVYGNPEWAAAYSK